MENNKVRELSLCAQTRWLIFNGVLFSAQNIRKPELSIKIII